MTRLIKFLYFISILSTASSFGASEEASQKVKYRSGKELDFEELLIQGQLKRPEISVVTGENKKGSDGLLRLRENFLDRVASDAGEEIP